MSKFVEWRVSAWARKHTFRRIWSISQQYILQMQRKWNKRTSISFLRVDLGEVYEETIIFEFFFFFFFFIPTTKNVLRREAARVSWKFNWYYKQRKFRKTSYFSLCYQSMCDDQWITDVIILRISPTMALLYQHWFTQSYTKTAISAIESVLTWYLA